MHDLIIVTSSATAPGAVSLLQSAKSQGYAAAIAVIGKDDIIGILNKTAKAIFRVGPRSYQYYVDILSQLPQVHKTTVQNMLQGFDKAATYRILSGSGISTPITSVHQRGDELTNYPVVMKILNGNQGIGVELIKNSADYHNFETAYPNQSTFLVQEFIAEANKQDKRLFIVGSECVAAMKRRSMSDDFRANLHTGGVAEPYEPSVEETELAIRTVKAFGLPYAGVDVIDSARGPLVLEVNPSPGLAISDVTKIDVATKIIQGVMQ